jgi:hypothetical protein
VWVLEAILGERLAVNLPHDPRFNSAVIEKAHWRQVFVGTRDWTLFNGDPSLNAWTLDVTVDAGEFKELLERELRTVVAQTRLGNSGPRSYQLDIIGAFKGLKAAGKLPATVKEQYREVLTSLGKDSDHPPKGYSVGTFKKARARALREN